MTSYKGQLYTNSKRGSKLANKGVILAILTLHYGSKLTIMKGNVYPFFVKNDPFISQF